MMCCGSSSLRSVCVSPEVELVQNPTQQAHNSTWLPFGSLNVTEVEDGNLPRRMRFERGGVQETCAVVHTSVDRSGAEPSISFTCANGDVVVAGVEDERRSADAPSAIYLLFDPLPIDAIEDHIDRYLGGIRRRMYDTLTKWVTAPGNSDLMLGLVKLAEDELLAPAARLLGFGDLTQETEGTEFTVSNYYAFASQLLVDLSLIHI